jgi:uncharacterized protein (DUF1800 family)
MYQTVPHENGATIESLTNLVMPVKTEVEAARGTSPSLGSRIASVVTAAGERIQDPELVDAHKSSQFTYASTSTLRERLDISDTFSQWLAGDSALSRNLHSSRRLRVCRISFGPVLRRM